VFHCGRTDVRTDILLGLLGDDLANHSDSCTHVNVSDKQTRISGKYCTDIQGRIRTKKKFIELLSQKLRLMTYFRTVYVCWLAHGMKNFTTVFSISSMT